MVDNVFAGDKKEGVSVLHHAEKPQSQSGKDHSIRLLSQIAQSNINAYYDKLENNSTIILDALKTVTQPK